MEQQRQGDQIIVIKRIYERPQPDDGYRVLVDRLWPRGLTREKATINVWAKEIAPSTELRRWFSHEHAQWQEFRKRYRAELAAPALAPLLADLVQRAKSTRLTLLFAAANETENNARVLRELLMEKLRAQDRN